MEYNTTFTIPIKVIYDFTKGSKGSRDRYGCPLDPDTAPDVDILEVIADKIDKITLDEIKEEILEAALKEMRDDID